MGPDRWTREGADGIYDNLLGIPLWGQRLPVWADWRHEQGQYGRAAATVNDELLEMTVHAKGTLAEVFPELPARPFRLATFHGDV